MILFACCSSTFAQVKETKEETQIKAPPKKKKKKFKVVIDPPRFPDNRCEGKTKIERYKCSKQALNDFIYDNIQYPPKAKNESLEGTCIILFIIDEKGRVRRSKIVKDIGSGCGEEALRVINSMPNWIPGSALGNEPIYFRIPITFKLE